MASNIAEYDYLIKLLIIGDSRVGKTSLLMRYVDQNFAKSMLSAIGADFRFKSIEIDREIFKLQIWDTMGNYRFTNYFKSYFMWAQGIVFVYDSSNEESFKSIKFWNDREDKVIEKSRALELAKEINAEFFEVSAKDGRNVNEVFEYLVIEIKNWINCVFDAANII
ncbi:unnamed protein product [Blepharisma stoltei]|uniref:Uncharacterized protein n=1 Tax=Blepharisma stoltei TaxID=1481888 RepID=A0AAU9KAC7_9CILI|nr:unnamed protein product [Blepharisma stoltei]